MKEETLKKLYERVAIKSPGGPPWHGGVPCDYCDAKDYGEMRFACNMCIHNGFSTMYALMNTAPCAACGERSPKMFALFDKTICKACLQEVLQNSGAVG